MTAKKRLATSWPVLAATYAVALLAAVWTYRNASALPPLLAWLLADIAATLAVWLIGLAFENASLYDPFWSVAPPALMTAWALADNLQATIRLPAAMLFVLVLAWSLRLTWNWARGWQGLAHQDWRYSDLKQGHPRLWFLTNIAGIHLMPTLLVFGGLLAPYHAIQSATGDTINSWLFFAAGLLACVGAIAVQAIADQQLLRFRRSPHAPDAILNAGLWKYSRHPNYFGEILFWWGVWMVSHGIGNTPAWTLAGPAAITLLFFFVSVPLMERHLVGRRPSYADYARSTSMLVPWFQTGEAASNENSAMR